jgi:hypothetical protein
MMANSIDTKQLLDEWRAVPVRVTAMIGEHSDERLNELPGSDGLTRLELVHHLTEANVIAAGMIIAALGSSGSTFDWSWLWPNKQWVERMGYARVPAHSSAHLLSALISHVSHVIAAAGDDGAQRRVTLFDTPGGETYSKTVAELVRQEIDHADEHLNDVDVTL